jgi:DNA polymerase-4
MPVEARLACLDLDTFFVSVERLLDPSLEGKAVIVGGGPGKRGVVTSASYEVRAFGVRSGMPMGEALRLAPHAVCVPPRHATYGPYARRVKEVAERWCPVVQTASIDEFFLDFHGCERLYRSPADGDDEAAVERVLREICAAIRAEIGLPASAGIGATRAVAKMASNRAKPAGVWLVRGGAEVAFASALPVRKFPGIGPVAEKALVDAGVTTLGGLLDLPPALAGRFERTASVVRAALLPTRADTLGRDHVAFHEHDPGGLAEGGLSNERTFAHDVGDTRVVLDQLAALTERVCWRVRQRGVRARTVVLKLRYADFHTISRSRTGPPTDAEDVVLAALRGLLAAAWSGAAVRLLGVGLANLVAPDPQLRLPLTARPRAGAAIDAVRAKFGYDAVRLGVVRGG